MATLENKEVSWFKIIAGSAIGTVIGYFSIMIFCFLCYLVLFVIIFASAGTSLNSKNLYNDLVPVMNSIK